MKSWADYNSSDDEDGDDFYVEENKSPYPEVQEPLPPVDYPIDYSKKENNIQPQFQNDRGGNNIERQPQKERRRKSFILPDRPPFTAFIGNLAFSVKNPDELGQRISELTMGRFGKQIYVTASRVAIDRRDGKHKGFGYVEVETLDDLKAVLDLDDGNSIIAGRSIHLDVAQPQRPSQVQRSGSEGSWGSFSNRAPSFGSGEVDGSKFQGGRHIMKKKESFKRQGSSSSDAPQQRPTFKLLPRRKDLDDKSSSATSSSAKDIFGGAKPRDINAVKPRDFDSVKSRDSDAAKPKDSDAAKPQDSDATKPKDVSATKPQDSIATKPRDASRKQDSAREITKIEKPPHQQQKGGNNEKKSSRGGGRNTSGKGGRGGERGKAPSKNNRRDGNNNKDTKKQQKKEEPRKVSQILVKKVEPKPQPKSMPSSNKFAALFDSDSDSD